MKTAIFISLCGIAVVGCSNSSNDYSSTGSTPSPDSNPPYTSTHVSSDVAGPDNVTNELKVLPNC